MRTSQIKFGLKFDNEKVKQLNRGSYFFSKLLFVLILLLAACMPGQAPAQSEPEAETEPLNVVATIGEVQDLDGWLAGQVSDVCGTA